MILSDPVFRTVRFSLATVLSESPSSWSMVMYVPDVLVGSVADPDPPDPYNFPGSVSIVGLDPTKKKLGK